jgi:mono/diheme cytochrome c family protein
MKTHSLCLRVAIASAFFLAAYFLMALPSPAQQSDSTASQERKWNYTALACVPAKARTAQNPLENDPDRVAAGGKLFDEHCSECHGRKAEGGKRGPSLLKPEVRDASSGSLFWILTNGVLWRGMPDWSKLPEAQRWQLVAFLKSFNTPASN